MFAKVLMCCFIAYVSAGAVLVEPVHAPQPYSFGYDNVDEFGTRHLRQETSDEFNNKVGSYGYVDAKGLTRTVNYVADAAGFRATVDTNEPGTKTSAPANALYNSAADVVAHPAVVNAAPVVHGVAPVVHGVAPVAVHAAAVGVHAAPYAFAARPVAPVAFPY